MQINKIAARQTIMEYFINSNLLLDILEDMETLDELPSIETADGRRISPSGNDWLLIFVEACS
jgi:hypothetical protein|tara:strand:+ start:134 stop:322 length:189 start_codon:yes stop_codon:yes gene_type:complete